jgi:hypothetical protein
MYECVNQHMLKPEVAGDPANPVLIVVTNGNPLEHCDVSEHFPHYTIEAIRERAETVTPLLKGIPDFWPPEHWAINE